MKIKIARCKPLDKAQWLQAPCFQLYHQVEYQLYRLWGEILQQRINSVTVALAQFDPDRDKSRRLKQRIEAQFQVALPADWLQHNQTIYQQSLALRKHPHLHIPYEPIIQWQAGCSGAPPLIFFPPSLFGAEVYGELSQLLQTDSAVYAVNSHNLYSGEQFMPFLTVLAKRYKKYIATRVPEGPYFLGGFSYGGTLALEVAQQFLAEGQAVLAIYLLDTPCYDSVQLRHVLRMITLKGIQQEFPNRIGHYLGELPQPMLEHVLAATRNDIKLLMRHRNQIYHKPVVSFQSRHSLPHSKLFLQRKSHGWEKFLRDLTTTWVDCDHNSILCGAHLPSLARTIAQDMRNRHAAHIARLS